MKKIILIMLAVGILAGSAGAKESDLSARMADALMGDKGFVLRDNGELKITPRMNYLLDVNAKRSFYGEFFVMSNSSGELDFTGEPVVAQCSNYTPDKLPKSGLVQTPYDFLVKHQNYVAKKVVICTSESGWGPKFQPEEERVFDQQKEFFYLITKNGLFLLFL